MRIAVDFDGTIVEHAYPEIGKPIPFAIDVLKRLQNDGHQIILWTVREGKLLDDAVAYCRQRGLEFYAVNRNHPEDNIAFDPRKLSVELFIDDRNLGGLPAWGVIYQMIKNNRAWQPATADNVYSSAEQKRQGGVFSRLFKK
ncbi:MAG: hypothetical protein Q4D14_03535 [Bacteroidales bacterium]|nr:hypothetical protein [Bacteroidales bacterium]